MNTVVAAGELIRASFAVPLRVLADGAQATAASVRALSPFSFIIGIAAFLGGMFLIVEFLAADGGRQ